MPCFILADHAMEREVKRCDRSSRDGTHIKLYSIHSDRTFDMAFLVWELTRSDGAFFFGILEDWLLRNVPANLFII